MMRQDGPGRFASQIAENGLIVFDQSESMRPELKAVYQAVRAFAAEAGPSDKISVITVKDSADLNLAPTNLAPTKEADQVLRELGPVTDEGKTRSSTASISAWTVCSKLARRNRHS